MDFTPESVASFLTTVASFPIRAVIVSDIDSLVFRNDYDLDEIMEHGEVEVRFLVQFHAVYVGSVSQRRNSSRFQTRFPSTATTTNGSPPRV